jgi:hypothetical protein
MLTLSAKSETLVNDFNDLSIKNDIYDSHKVSEYANGVDDDDDFFCSSKFYVRVRMFLK